MAFKLRPLSDSDDLFISNIYQDPVIMHHICATLSVEQASTLCTKMLAEVEGKSAIYQVITTHDGGHKAGLLSMHWDPNTESVESGMIVVPAFQNQGVCKWAQMNAMQSIQEVFPAKLCTVYISADNVAANTSYENMGFVAVENTSSANKHLNLNRWDFNMELFKQ